MRVCHQLEPLWGFYLLILKVDYSAPKLALFLEGNTACLVTCGNPVVAFLEACSGVCLTPALPGIHNNTLPSLKKQPPKQITALLRHRNTGHRTISVWVFRCSNSWCQLCLLN